MFPVRHDVVMAHAYENVGVADFPKLNDISEQNISPKLITRIKGVMEKLHKKSKVTLAESGRVRKASLSNNYAENSATGFDIVKAEEKAQREKEERREDKEQMRKEKAEKKEQEKRGKEEKREEKRKLRC